MTIPKPPKFAVQTRTIDSRVILEREPELPYAVYAFGGGRKQFLDKYQGEGIYEKPVSISGGHTSHLSDPDLDTTISPPPAPSFLGY